MSGQGTRSGTVTGRGWNHNHVNRYGVLGRHTPCREGESADGRDRRPASGVAERARHALRDGSPPLVRALPRGRPFPRLISRGAELGSQAADSPVYELWTAARRAAISGQSAWFRAVADRSRNRNRFSHYGVSGRHSFQRRSLANDHEELFTSSSTPRCVCGSARQPPGWSPCPSVIPAEGIG